MQPQEITSPTIAKRDPAQVMRLSRLGSFHQSRLSFMRILTRRMTRENWTFTRPVFEFDAKGVGHAVYCARTPDRTYSLIAFGHDLPPEERSDRVIATRWDSTFTLFDGVPDAADIDRLRRNIPLQEAGRVSEKLKRNDNPPPAVSALALGRSGALPHPAPTHLLMRLVPVEFPRLVESLPPCTSGT